MYFDDIKVGMTVQIPPALIEKQKMLDFARLYDNIPLHTDKEYAKTPLRTADCAGGHVLHGGMGEISGSGFFRGRTACRKIHKN